MEIQYSKNGFEQDNTPQLCIEGTNMEYHSLIKIIKSSLTDIRDEDFYILKSNIDKECYEVFFTKSKHANKLVNRLDVQTFQISLNIDYWQKVIQLLEPLTHGVGYQFIEFDQMQIEGDIGLLFYAK